MKKIVLLLLLSANFVAYSQRKTKTENVILITLDGMRWQEVFGGAELRLISKQFVADSAAVRLNFWDDTPELRRERLMPFLWKTLAPKGRVYGNRAYGNFANVTNKQWFSYPGYNELLSGSADDERVRSNDKFDNPNQTVLEFLNKQPVLRGKIVAYTSWDVFPYIINERRSGIPVNAGLVKASGNTNEEEKILNRMMDEVPNPLGEVRLDAFTFHYGLEYMKQHKPNVMYFSFDETDDFAHSGKYDLYLKSARATDFFIKQLWEWCQSDAQYRDKTTFIITCDHGRGSVNPGDWQHHGIKVPGADQIWMALIGPDTPADGEIKSKGQIYQNQIARTIAALLGYDYSINPKAGAVLTEVIR